MCGFLGRLSPAGFCPARPLSAGLPWLARRGPDSQNFWASASGEVEFLHARLAIIDRTERAHQPLSADGRDVTLMFVGEIYNHRDLRAGLSEYDFRTDSDTEVILATYLKHGAAGLKRLRGMFTIAIADLEKGEVLLARDPVGKKPLYVAQWGEGLYFGSSLLPMRAAHDGGVSLNEAAVSQFWSHEFVFPNGAIFDGARPVMPGRVERFSLSGAAQGSESCVPDDAPVWGGESFEEAEARAGALMDRAVRRRLENNSERAVLLSGGIDSTAVAAAVARVSREEGEPVRALTLGSVIPRTNDEPWARMAADRLDLPLRVVRPHRERLADMAARCLDRQDEPLGMISHLTLTRLVEAIAGESRILIGGDGGDEIFLGYGGASAWREKSGDGPAPDPADWAMPMPDWFGGWARLAVTRDLVGHGFVKADRASAEQGVEIRAPLVDWDVISYVRSLPADYVLYNGETKALLKRMLAGWPDRFINRPKRGLTYNLRWAWLPSNYAGLREMIDPEACDRFGAGLPTALRGQPMTWSGRTVHANFVDVWKLAAWSAFSRRLAQAARAA